jgi:hypothetical protein
MAKIPLIQKKWLVVGGLVVIASYFVYQSPDTNNLSNNTVGAMSKASLYSYWVRSGYKTNLKLVAIDVAKLKLEKDEMTSLRDVPIWAEISNVKVPPEQHYLWHPAVAQFEKENEAVQLLMFEKYQNFYLFTFSGNFDNFTTEPVTLNNRPMLVSVAVRYYSGDKENLFKQYFRKFCNLEILPDFINKIGERGGWVLVDYQYNFNTKQYYDFVKENGPKLYAEAEIKKSDYLKNISEGKFFDALQANISKSYDDGLLFTANRLPQQQIFAEGYLKK